MTPQEKLDVIQKPFLRPKDIQGLLESSRSSIYKALKTSGLRKYPPFGYATEEVIETFNLKSSIKRWKAA